METRTSGESEKLTVGFIGFRHLVESTILGTQMLLDLKILSLVSPASDSFDKTPNSMLASSSTATHKQSTSLSTVSSMTEDEEIPNKKNIDEKTNKNNKDEKGGKKKKKKKKKNRTIGFQTNSNRKMPFRKFAPLCVILRTIIKVRIKACNVEIPKKKKRKKERKKEK